jgi:hypothetical protein
LTHQVAGGTIAVTLRNRGGRTHMPDKGPGSKGGAKKPKGGGKAAAAKKK